MTLKRKSGGAFVDVGVVKRRSGGAWVIASTVKRRLSGAWVTVWTALNFNDQTVSQGGTILGQVAGYRINTSGIAEAKNRTSYTTRETWLTTGAAADYEAYCTYVGDVPAGTTGSWVALSTSPEWSIGTSTIGEVLFTSLTIQIRLVSSGTVIDTFFVELDAERF